MEKWEKLRDLIGKNKCKKSPAESLYIADSYRSFSGGAPDENQGGIYSENSSEILTKNQDKNQVEIQAQNVSKFPILKSQKMICKSYRNLPSHPVHPAVCDWHFQEADPICRLQKCVNFRAME